MDANFKSMGHGCPLRLPRELSTSVIIPLEKYHSSPSPQTIGILSGGHFPTGGTGGGHFLIDGTSGSRKRQN